MKATDGPEFTGAGRTAAETTGDTALVLTGERTLPGLPEENYWFRRHEVVYEWLAPRCAGRRVLEAGCGEGYGADLIARVAEQVVALDYDDAAVAHVAACYPAVQAVKGNLAELPLPDGSVDVVVNLQVIEHLWDQPGFVAECARVLRPSGLLIMSTPNRITFSPGRDTPLNPFHTRELNAAELTELVVENGFVVDTAGSGAATTAEPAAGVYGVFHGATLRELGARHGGSLVDAQIEHAVAGTPWPAELARDVAAVATADFDIVAAGTDADHHIDDSLDLIVVAVRR